MHPSPGPSFVTKLNVTNVCHMAASMASDVNNDNDVAGDVADNT